MQSGNESVLFSQFDRCGTKTQRLFMVWLWYTLTFLCICCAHKQPDMCGVEFWQCTQCVLCWLVLCLSLSTTQSCYFSKDTSQGSNITGMVTSLVLFNNSRVLDVVLLR